MQTVFDDTKQIMLFRRTFRGRGSFPLQMLQSDRCFPYCQSDIALIYDSFGADKQDETVREISVLSCREQFNLIQWAMYGWTPKLPD